MRQVLHESNQDLLREINYLLVLIEKSNISPELKSYHEHISKACQELEIQIQNNIHRIATQSEDVFSTLLSETQRLSRELKLYNHRFVGPLVRTIELDCLPLRILNWLHIQHSITREIPAAISNGEFTIWPDPDQPTIYAIPVSTQQSLLYQPVMFHEFGHLLYACHQERMDKYTRDLREQIDNILTPWIQRDDVHALRDKKRRKAIVETWYYWTEELFCDAVGLTIGGPAFLDAFDHYMRIAERSEYHSSRHQLEYRTHPISKLRMRLLVYRAFELGHAENPQSFEQNWMRIATLLQLPEDYFGFYEEGFFPIIWETLSRMLQEADPYCFSQYDRGEHELRTGSSPVHLVNRAWYIYKSEPERYPDWERNAVKLFCEKGMC
jgi:hypothetical protein